MIWSFFHLRTLKKKKKKYFHLFLCSWPTSKKTSRSSVDDMYTHIVSCVLLKDILRMWKQLQRCWLLQLVGILETILSITHQLPTFTSLFFLFFFFFLQKKNSPVSLQDVFNESKLRRKKRQKEKLESKFCSGYKDGFFLSCSPIPVPFFSFFCFNFFEREGKAGHKETDREACEVTDFVCAVTAIR